MKNYKTLFIVGLIILIIPFLGVPEIYKNWANIIVALFILISAFRERIFIKSQNKNHDVFAESNNEKKEDSNLEEELISQGEEFEEKIIKEDNE